MFSSKNTPKHKFELGQRLRDTASGFTGIATARCEYLNGCIQYGIKPPVGEDGKMLEVFYIDEGQLEVVDNGIFPHAQTIGGPSADAPKS